ncbi:MAG: hypothetical protein AAF664_11015 [Planctomycetota bacterium]
MIPIDHRYGSCFLVLSDRTFASIGFDEGEAEAAPSRIRDLSLVYGVKIGMSLENRPKLSRLVVAFS